MVGMDMSLVPIMALICSSDMYENGLSSGFMAFQVVYLELISLTILYETGWAASTAATNRVATMIFIIIIIIRSNLSHLNPLIQI